MTRRGKQSAKPWGEGHGPVDGYGNPVKLTKKEAAAAKAAAAEAAAAEAAAVTTAAKVMEVEAGAYTRPLFSST